MTKDTEAVDKYLSEAWNIYENLNLRSVTDRDLKYIILLQIAQLLQREAHARKGKKV